LRSRLRKATLVRSQLDHEAALEVDGEARDRVAGEEEPGQDPEVHRHQEDAAVLGGEGAPVSLSASFTPTTEAGTVAMVRIA